MTFESDNGMDAAAAAQQVTADQEQKRRAWLASLFPYRQGILSRFVSYFRRLRAFPRSTRRVFQRRVATTLAGAALLLALGRMPVHAATIVVAKNEVGINENNKCSLIEAIENANSVPAVPAPHDDCAAGTNAGADTIRLPKGTFKLNSTQGLYYGSQTGLPLITSEVVIEGKNTIIRRNSGAANFRILAVANSGDLTLNKVKIQSGASQGRGGGIYNAGTLNLMKTTVLNNDANGSGGGISNYQGTLTMQNSTLSGNEAGVHGGGIFDYDGQIEIQGGMIKVNDAAVDGGAILTENGTITVDGTKIQNNTAENGGGVFSYGGNVTIEDSTISGNDAAEHGGGVLNEYYATMMVIDSTLSKNEAGVHGGAAYNRMNATLTVEESVVQTNEAADQGGGANNYAATIEILDTTFSNNDAAYGGALYTSGFYDYDLQQGLYGTLVITDSLITNNEATGDGGGLGADNYSDVTVWNSTISNNSAAGDGGGIDAFANSTNITINQSTLSGNEAGGDGGGIYNAEFRMTLVNSTLTGNTAGDDGGGLASYNGGADLYNVTITKNSASRGGGVYGYVASVSFRRSLISGNSAPIDREVYASPAVANSHNIFGFNNNSGVGGFVPGATDIVPTVALNSILAGAAKANGGITFTHALPTNSPAIDAAPGLACLQLPVGGDDQRGLPRNVNGKGGASVLECDIGAFERQ